MNETSTMAKKQSDDAAAPDKAAPDPAAAPEQKKGGGGKGKEAKAKPDAAPAAAAAAQPAEGAPATATATPAAPVESTKKKGQLPGKPPRRGKKLRNLLKQQVQKVAKEGAVPLKRALQMLKTIKRAKFDETVEIHMSL